MRNKRQNPKRLSAGISKMSPRFWRVLIFEYRLKERSSTDSHHGMISLFSFLFRKPWGRKTKSRVYSALWFRDSEEKVDAEAAMDGSEARRFGFGKKSGPQYTHLDNPFLRMARSPPPPPPPPPTSYLVTASQRSPRYSFSALCFWEFSFLMGVESTEDWSKF